ncbi:uncharacterized protein ColSpa_07003 [Colletotrichum spaethianum]|uniref:Uncharacterized protein n=1 Tax=Colletotrichum spaethianum TaxID=700344 RepID=A0AA37NZ13_9PEZI|nr:uncharacterized protein ColSpa_07003 [Colletotrichum spaethianum]GKT46822.1 hypothetical protein ColSpa_07003 [Colletotrichum spaethianum]
MSPRSFLYYNRQPSASTTPSSSPSSSSPTPKPTSNSHAASSSSNPVQTTTAPINTSRTALPSALLDRKKDAQNVSVTVTPIPTTSTTTSATMAKRKDARRETSKLAPSSPPRTTTSVTTRPTTPTTPVQIPSKTKSNPFHASHRHAQRKTSRPRDVHSPDAVPPAMLALLAVTDIPRPRRSLKQRLARDQPMTLEAVIERQQVCEKELSLTFGSKSPMDLLLSPPDDLTDDDMSVSDSGLGSVLSTRTVSVESVPSLGDSFSTDTLSSLGSPYGPSPRRKRSRQPRRSLEPVSSPPGQPEDHPLSRDRVNVEDLDFRVFDESQDEEDTKSEFSFSDYTFPLRPLKSAFKSNLTASLRALRSAARSISAINFSSIPPDDFLTRSILTIDPKVPYTDERRPPVLEEEPSAALRRYLNPTTNARIEPHPNTATPTGTRSFTASIQMQTYKVQRSRSAPPTSTRSPSPTTSAGTTQSTPYQPPTQSPNQTAFTYPPGGMRQREMRENSDFIRIAVMEMAMRKQGKLDDQRPGRARWALPPRKANVRAYEVGADGVPARWIPVSN